MNIRKFFLIVFIFFISCFKAERSPFDTSTPKGLVVNVVIQTLSKQSLGTADIKPPPVEQVSKPSFNLTPGYYATAQFISLSTSTSGAVIYFTLDGQTPSTSSMLYTEPIHIWKLAGKTIRAIAVKEGMLQSEVLDGFFSYPPLKTGVIQCATYTDPSWQWISCPTNDRQDGEVQKGVARSYTDNGDGTVMDNATGLLWQKCAKGKTGSDCLGGNAEVQDWTAADSYCKSLSLAGKVWRLPTITELQTLVDFSKSGPHVDPTYFPNAPSSVTPFYAFWSSTTFSVDTSKKFTIASWNGDVNPLPQTASHYVRCVSGEYPREYVENFTDNGDGTITDHTTKLVWQKCSLGQTNDSNCTGAANSLDWSHAITNCVNLNLAGKVWRLPNMNELFSLWNTSASTALNSTFFPNSAERYWTSTSYTNGSGGWDIGFTSFNASPVGKGMLYSARCVTDL